MVNAPLPIYQRLPSRLTSGACSPIHRYAQTTARKQPNHKQNNDNDNADVDTIPVNGTWFQLIANGTTSVNLGPTGLQRLDKVVQFAEEAGVLLIMSLTNNWNPRPLLDNTTAEPVDTLTRRDVTTGTNNSLPRNTRARNRYRSTKSRSAN